MAKIIVKRLPGFMSRKAPGWGFKITTDGKSNIFMGESKEFEISPGQHTLSVSSLVGDSNTLSFEINEGESKKIEIQIGAHAKVRPLVLVLIVPINLVNFLNAYHFIPHNIFQLILILATAIFSFGIGFTCFRKDWLFIEDISN